MCTGFTYWLAHNVDRYGPGDKTRPLQIFRVKELNEERFDYYSVGLVQLWNKHGDRRV